MAGFCFVIYCLSDVFCIRKSHFKQCSSCSDSQHAHLHPLTFVQGSFCNSHPNSQNHMEGLSFTWPVLKRFVGLNVQFSSVAQSCPTLCDPMNRSTLGLPVHHQLLEFSQTHVLQVGDGIQPSYPLSSPSPPAPNPSQHQGLFQWVNSSHEVAKVLEFQLQHQSFQWTPRTGLL